MCLTPSNYYRIITTYFLSVWDCLPGYNEIVRGFLIWLIRVLLVVGGIGLFSACSPHIVLSENIPVTGNTTSTISPVQPATQVQITTLEDSPTPEPSSTPLPTALPPVDEMLALGDYHTCRLHSDGTVSCWGWNEFGQTGHNIQENSEEDVIASLVGVTQITAGSYHTCALNWQGKVYCWGRNNVGQLGNEQVKGTVQPILVEGLSDQTIRQISAGSTHTCALNQSGEIYCWGSNKDGKLGAGSSNSFSDRALPVIGLENPFVQVSAGGSHTCALDISGKVWCWGDGKDGQTGQGGFDDQPLPVIVNGLPTPAIKISSGWYHICAQTVEGKVNCWGKNSKGQLGNASTVSQAKPVPSVGLNDGVIQLAAGGQQSCALKRDALYCWGDDYLDKTSLEVVLSHLTPYIIPIRMPVKSLYLGGSHSCIIATNNEVRCWGADDHNQLGKYQFAFPQTAQPVD